MKSQTTVSDLIQKYYAAYEQKDRKAIEPLLTDDFSFSSPHDDHINRASYFSRCWPNSERIRSFYIEKLFEKGNEAFAYMNLNQQQARNSGIQSSSGLKETRSEKLRFILGHPLARCSIRGQFWLIPERSFSSIVRPVPFSIPVPFSVPHSLLVSIPGTLQPGEGAGVQMGHEWRHFEDPNSHS
jgi:hypothetical protein